MFEAVRISKSKIRNLTVVKCGMKQLFRIMYTRKGDLLTPDQVYICTMRRPDWAIQLLRDRLTPHLVEHCIKKAPKEVFLYAPEVLTDSQKKQFKDLPGYHYVAKAVRRPGSRRTNVGLPEEDITFEQFMKGFRFHKKEGDGKKGELKILEDAPFTTNIVARAPRTHKENDINIVVNCPIPDIPKEKAIHVVVNDPREIGFEEDKIVAAVRDIKDIPDAEVMIGRTRFKIPELRRMIASSGKFEILVNDSVVEGNRKLGPLDIVRIRKAKPANRQRRVRFPDHLRIKLEELQEEISRILSEGILVDNPT